MPQDASKMTYDPVPPYDLQDIEAAASSNPSDSQPEDVQPASVITAVTEPSGRAGKLTEKECCAYAFGYFLTSVIGLVLIVLIIAYFNYLTRKKSG
jgi:hypothetical protein